MSVNLKRQVPLLKLLQIAPPKILKVILANADPKLISAICEISLNLCKGNLKCCNKDRKKLKRHRKKLYKLAAAKKNQKQFSTERRILTQQGGAFLPLLIPAALAALEFIRSK